jgi:aspartyl-tRNA(Asn)/glutamyl-tRNA(Gln) amidotransferase subunit B
VEEKNLGLLGVDSLREVVVDVVSENPQAVDDYHAGTEKAVEYLLGQVLRRVRARGDPNKVRELIMEVLGRE